MLLHLVETTGVWNTFRRGGAGSRGEGSEGVRW